MARFILTRITLLFFVLLVLGLGAGLAYQMLYIAPAKKCEAQGRWWADRWRACATPVNLLKMQIPKFVEPTAAPAAPAVPAPKKP